MGNAVDQGLQPFKKISSDLKPRRLAPLAVNAEKTSVIAAVNRFHVKQLGRGSKNLSDYFHRFSPVAVDRSCQARGGVLDPESIMAQILKGCQHERNKVEKGRDEQPDTMASQ